MPCLSIFKQHSQCTRLIVKVTGMDAFKMYINDVMNAELASINYLSHCQGLINVFLILHWKLSSPYVF